jgi:hypothetical protein
MSKTDIGRLKARRREWHDREFDFVVARTGSAAAFHATLVDAKR